MQLEVGQVKNFLNSPPWQQAAGITEITDNEGMTYPNARFAPDVCGMIALTKYWPNKELFSGLDGVGTGTFRVLALWHRSTQVLLRSFNLRLGFLQVFSIRCSTCLELLPIHHSTQSLNLGTTIQATADGISFVVMATKSTTRIGIHVPAGAVSTAKSFSTG